MAERSSSGHGFTKILYSKLVTAAKLMEDFLDFHGAKNSAEWYKLRELTACVLHLSITSYAQKHILNRLTNYDTLVVTGHRPNEIKSFIQRYNCREVHNPDYEKGMTTSLKTGLRAINDDVDAAFMVLSDTFGFKPSLLDSMEKKMATSSALLVSPKYEGRRGHPVLVAKELFQEILDLEEDETMRDIVLRHEDVHKYVLGDIWVTLDLDTLDDYERVKKLWIN